MEVNKEQQELIAAVMEQMSFPPYNLEQIGDNGLRLTLAVTGFTMDEIDIKVTDDFIVIEGNKKVPQGQEDENRKFLHHGIAEQSFRKQFPLWRQIKIEGASFDNGFLIVDAVRVEPKAVVPEKVEIKAANKMWN